MKALSVRSPWAELIADGSKRLENRSRRTLYRGPLAIHRSGKGGAVIAVCEVVDCVNLDEAIAAAEQGVNPPWEEEQDCYAVGPWVWILSCARRVRPVRCKGKLGIWTVPEDVAKQLEKGE